MKPRIRSAILAIFRAPPSLVLRGSFAGFSRFLALNLPFWPIFALFFGHYGCVRASCGSHFARASSSASASFSSSRGMPFASFQRLVALHS
jgi:hypothetical protein